MSTAAAPVEATLSPLVEELEELLVTFGSLGRQAQIAVTAVVESLTTDFGVSAAERDLAAALLTLAARPAR